MTLTYNKFEECVKDLVKISSGFGDGWIIRRDVHSQGGEIFLEKRIVRQKFIVTDDSENTLEKNLLITFVFHVIFSQSYSVPVLYFNATNPNGRPLRLDEIWKLIPNCHTRKDDFFNGESSDHSVGTAECQPEDILLCGNRISTRSYFANDSHSSERQAICRSNKDLSELYRTSLSDVHNIFLPGEKNEVLLGCMGPNTSFQKSLFQPKPCSPRCSGTGGDKHLVHDDSDPFAEKLLTSCSCSTGDISHLGKCNENAYIGCGSKNVSNSSQEPDSYAVITDTCLNDHREHSSKSVTMIDKLVMNCDITSDAVKNDIHCPECMCPSIHKLQIHGKKTISDNMLNFGDCVNLHHSVNELPAVKSFEEPLFFEDAISEYTDEIKSNEISHSFQADSCDNLFDDIPISDSASDDGSGSGQSDSGEIPDARWSMISQTEHPKLGSPCFMLHPCYTSDFMSTFSSSNYLISWLSIVGPVVGLDIPLGYAKFVHKQ